MPLIGWSASILAQPRGPLQHFVVDVSGRELPVTVVRLGIARPTGELSPARAKSVGRARADHAWDPAALMYPSLAAGRDPIADSLAARVPSAAPAESPTGVTRLHFETLLPARGCVARTFETARWTDSISSGIGRYLAVASQRSRGTGGLTKGQYFRFLAKERWCMIPFPR